MKFLKTFIGVISILLLFVSCDFRSSDYYLSESEKLEAEDKYAEAIILLDKAIAKNPKNIYALINRGTDKSMLEDYNGAIEDYSKVIEIDSINTLAFFNRGLNKQRKEDYHSAIDDFNRAIKTKGLENFRMDKSVNFFSKSGEFDVPMEEIRLERGYARYNSDSLQVALEDFYFCIENNFQLGLSYYMAGLVFLDYNMIEDACNALMQARLFGNLDAEDMIETYCKK